MKTFSEIKPGLLSRSSLALGFFDGVHPGHASVIKKAVEEGRAQGAVPAMVTFREHPRQLTLGKSPPLLTMPEQRLELAGELGIEAILMLSFTEDLCRLSPRDYVKQVLIDCMGAVSLSVGFNHTFGRNRAGNPALLAEIGSEMGFAVHVAGAVFQDGAEISSSRIRQELTAGGLADANRLLGRPYSVVGEVTRGDGRGRTIGFPTANIVSDPALVLPHRGVYCGRCRLADGRVLPVVINIGLRPTFDDTGRTTTEVHIFDFDEDLYGQQLTVWFHEFLRAEKKFSGPEALVAQINEDCQIARAKMSGIDAVGCGSQS